MNNISEAMLESEMILAANKFRTLKVKDTVTKASMKRRILGYNIVKRNLNSGNLTKADIHAIFNALDYKSVADFEAAIRKAGLWLRAQVRRRPYALLMSQHSPMSLNSPDGRFKSVHWLAHKAVESIGRWPALTTQSSKHELLKAYELGIRTFVHLDDASYSGSDMYSLILRFASTFRNSENVWLFIAAGYVSPFAQTTLIKAEIASLPQHIHVRFYAPKSLKMTSEFLNSLPTNQRERVTRFLERDLNGNYNKNPVRNKPFAMLAHKIPNNVSFAPGLVYLIGELVQPPYKDLNYYNDNAMIDWYYNKNGMRHYVFLNNNKKKYKHVAHKNVRGKLVPVKQFTSARKRPAPRWNMATRRPALQENVPRRGTKRKATRSEKSPPWLRRTDLQRKPFRL